MDAFTLKHGGKNNTEKNWPILIEGRLLFKAEAAVTLRKNKKIAILALTPTLNLDQTLTLALTVMLILTQTQNLTQNPNYNF